MWPWQAQHGLSTHYCLFAFTVVPMGETLCYLYCTEGETHLPKAILSVSGGGIGLNPGLSDPRALALNCNLLEASFATPAGWRDGEDEGEAEGKAGGRWQAEWREGRVGQGVRMASALECCPRVVGRGGAARLGWGARGGEGASNLRRGRESF